ncbi:MAG: hypothetical protein R2688_00110 [Fimbriimonadaceae bacterium]
MRHNDAETDLKEAFRREIIADADAQPSIEVEFEKAEASTTSKFDPVSRVSMS